MDLIKTEIELKKRLPYNYSWGRKQNNHWDSLTNFVYQIDEFDDLVKSVKKTFHNLSKKQKVDKTEFFNYAANRWYNFQSARAVEEIFCSLPGIIAAKNSRDRLVDFAINGINFDHKTSVFPREYGYDLDHAQKNKRELIQWLYDNQSQQQRKHMKNRLFIVLYKQNGKHWELKSEIRWLKNIIEDYVNTFRVENLLQFNFETASTTKSDIIWGIQ